MHPKLPHFATLKDLAQAVGVITVRMRQHHRINLAGPVVLGDVFNQAITGLQVPTINHMDSSAPIQFVTHANGVTALGGFYPQEIHFDAVCHV